MKIKLGQLKNIIKEVLQVSYGLPTEMQSFADRFQFQVKPNYVYDDIKMDYALVDTMGDVWAYYDTTTPNVGYITTDSETEPYTSYSLSDFDEITTQKELQAMIEF